MEKREGAGFLEKVLSGMFYLAYIVAAWWMGPIEINNNPNTPMIAGIMLVAFVGLIPIYCIWLRGKGFAKWAMKWNTELNPSVREWENCHYAQGARPCFFSVFGWAMLVLPMIILSFVMFN